MFPYLFSVFYLGLPMVEEPVRPGGHLAWWVAFSTHPKRGLSGLLINGTLSTIGLGSAETSIVHLTPGLIQRCKALLSHAANHCKFTPKAHRLFHHIWDKFPTYAASQTLNTYRERFPLGGSAPLDGSVPLDRINVEKSDQFFIL